MEGMIFDAFFHTGRQPAPPPPPADTTRSTRHPYQEPVRASPPSTRGNTSAASPATAPMSHRGVRGRTGP